MMAKSRKISTNIKAINLSNHVLVYHQHRNFLLTFDMHETYDQLTYFCNTLQTLYSNKLDCFSNKIKRNAK